MKVAFCSSEIVPFSKTGGLADVAGALPLALAKEGVDVKIFTPLYRGIQPDKVHKDYAVSKLGKKVEVIFVKNDAFFDRQGLYGTTDGDHPDNLDRFFYYCVQVLELCKKFKFKADIFHCHDWQTGLIPILLKSSYAQDAFFKKSRSVFTIHNLAYQGLFAAEEYEKMGLPKELFSIDGLEFYGKISVLKGALLFSDIVTTVSPTYAKEIQTTEFGCGLEGLLKKRSSRLFGIINGLDYSIWNPKTDTYIYKQFDASSVSAAKDVNKTRLQKEYGLAQDKKAFVLGLVGRLAEQKGVDLLCKIMPDIIEKLGAQVIVLGTGDKKYHKILEKTYKAYRKKKKYKDMFSLHLTFDNRMAHRIYAGCDCFLMPSRYEPCGLGQMISLKYASLPAVHSTGGLADTIVDYTGDKKKGNGFVFTKRTPASFYDALKRAHEVFSTKKEWQALMKKAMGYTFSWKKSAKEYCALYDKCLSLH